MISGSDHPLPKIKMEDGVSETISLPRPAKCSNRSPLLWLTFVLALVAVLLACFALPVCSRHQSAKTASSLAEFGNELQRLTNQTGLLAGRVGRIEERAIAAEAPKRSQINWLSWDLGARAIYHLSTPAIGKSPLAFTVVPKPWWCPWCEEHRFPTRGTWYDQRLFSGIGPDAALLPHSEHEPAYCTSGMMQLAVKLPRPIIPTELVIEHWRKDEVIIAGVTPRDVELWVEHGRVLVLAGKWIYNIHAHQEAQKFPVAFSDIAIERVAVRIDSNWGNSNQTCLVRAKLHGIDKSGIEERLVEE